MKIQILLIVMLLSVIVLSACGTPIVEGASILPSDGQVYALHLSSTLRGMKQASIGASGTSLFTKGDLTTFIWTLKDGWAFATINISTRQPIQNFANVARNANFVNVADMTDVVKVMLKNGWEIIPASALPTSVITALHGGMSWLTTLAGSMTSFFVVPAGILVTPELLQGYEQIQQ